MEVYMEHVSAVGIDTRPLLLDERGTEDTVQHPTIARIAHAAEERLEQIAHTLEEGRIALRDRALRLIDKADDYLEKRIPLFPHQKAIDQLAAMIQQRFAPLRAFNAWVYSTSGGAWYRELATYLCKLPLRAAMNVVQLLYDVVREALYFSIHPAKSSLRLARLCIRLLDALTTPEAWPLVGAGMLGSSCGYCLISGTPFPLIGGAIGAAMVIGGLSIGAMKRALLAESGKKRHEVGEFLSLQARKLPEAALTGFLMGLIVGGIQRAVNNVIRSKFRVLSYEEAKQVADTFIQKHHLPPYSEVLFDQTGKVIIKWGKGCDLTKFTEIELQRSWTEGSYAGGRFPESQWSQYAVEQATIELVPDASCCTLHMFVRYIGFAELWWDSLVSDLTLSRVASLMHDLSWVHNLYPPFASNLNPLALSTAIPMYQSCLKDRLGTEPVPAGSPLKETEVKT